VYHHSSDYTVKHEAPVYSHDPTMHTVRQVDEPIEHHHTLPHPHHHSDPFIESSPHAPTSYHLGERDIHLHKFPFTEHYDSKSGKYGFGHYADNEGGD